jgi:hypothetical protein
MGKKSFVDLGLDAVSEAADDPLGRFILRATRPLAQRGLDKVRGAFNGIVDDVKRAIGEDTAPARVEVRKGPIRAGVVFDAEIVDDDERPK